MLTISGLFEKLSSDLFKIIDYDLPGRRK